jgi:hypothetical protein
MQHHHPNNVEMHKSHQTPSQEAHDIYNPRVSENAHTDMQYKKEFNNGRQGTGMTSSTQAHRTHTPPPHRSSNAHHQSRTPPPMQHGHHEIQHDHHEIQRRTSQIRHSQITPNEVRTSHITPTRTSRIVHAVTPTPGHGHHGSRRDSNRPQQRAVTPTPGGRVSRHKSVIHRDPHLSWEPRILDTHTKHGSEILKHSNALEPLEKSATKRPELTRSCLFRESKIISESLIGT